MDAREVFGDARSLERLLPIACEMLRAVVEPDVPLGSTGRIDLGLQGDHGRTIEDVLETVRKVVVPRLLYTRHRLAMAHMVPPAALASILGDFLIGAMNQCAFIEEEGPIAADVERATVAWLATTLGYGGDFGGLLTSGGTASNLLATHLAYERARRAGIPRERLSIICSDQAHLSVEKTAVLVGLGREAVTRVPTDPTGRLVPGAVTSAVAVRRKAGEIPFLLICTAGTTNGGTLEDPSEFLAARDDAVAWCHVDAAHGGCASMLRAQPPAVRLWPRADSLSWDPHKSLFVGYSVGAFLVRDHRELAPLKFESDYALRDDRTPERDAGYLHFDGSRRFEALKLWMVIRNLGREGMRALTEHTCRLAARFADAVRRSDVLELATEPDTNIVCFGPRLTYASQESGGGVLEQVRARLIASGGPMLSTTRLGRRPVFRAVFSNPMLEAEEIEALVATIGRECVSALGAATVSATR